MSSKDFEEKNEEKSLNQESAEIETNESEIPAGESSTDDINGENEQIAEIEEKLEEAAQESEIDSEQDSQNELSEISAEVPAVETEESVEEEAAEENIEAEEIATEEIAVKEDAEEKAEGIVATPKKDGGFKKFIKKYKLAVIIAAIVLVLAAAITTTIMIINAPKVFIRSAADFEKDYSNKKQVFMLKKDIAVDGDLVINDSMNFNLNNKTLTVNGTLKIELSDADTSTVDIGTQKGLFNNKDFVSGGNIVAENVIIVAKGATFNLHSTMSLEGSLNVKKLIINEKLDITSGMLELKSADITLNNDATGTMKLTLSSLKMPSTASLDSLVADSNSTAVIYGAIKFSIVGGKEISLLGNASCPEIRDTADLYLQQETVTLGSANNISNIFIVIQLEKPSQLNIEQTGTNFTAVASKVNGADGYVFIIKDGDTVIATIPSTGNETDITSYITQPKNYNISVKAVGDDSRLKLASSELQIDYNYSIKLSNPQLTVSETESGDIILSFPSIDFAQIYKLNINGNEMSIDATENATTIIDITDHVQTAGAYYIKVAASYPGNSSFTDSDTVLSSYISYKKLEQPTVTVVRNNNILTVSWDSVANAKNYILNYDGSGKIITTATSKTFSAEDIEDGTTFSVYAQGIGYYESSEAALASFDYEQLDAPQNIRFGELGGSSLMIMADAVTAATSYTLYRNGVVVITNANSEFIVSNFIDGDKFTIEANAAYYKPATSSEITYTIAD